MAAQEGLDVMDCEAFGALLARARQEQLPHRWSQKALGIFLARESTRLGRPRPPIPRETIGRWEAGSQRPDEWNAYCLCKLLAMTPDALALGSVLTPSAIAVIEAATTSTVIHRSGDMIDAERLSHALLGLGRTDWKVAQDLRRLTDEELGQRGRIGTRLLVHRLHDHLRTLESMIPSAGSRDVHRELVLMAGETAAAAAQSWFTLFDYGTARLMCDHVRQLAHELGGSVVLALGHACEAILYANRLHGAQEGLEGGAGRAVELLHAAEAAVGPGAPAHVSLWLNALRSWERATLRDGIGAERDLDAADRALACMTGPPSGFFTPWDASYIAVARGKTALMLDRPVESVTHFDRALETAQDWMRPAYEIQLAAACIQAGQPERAGSLLLGTLDIARSTGTTMLLSRIASLASNDLAPYASVPLVRELRERAA